MENVYHAFVFFPVANDSLTWARVAGLSCTAQKDDAFIEGDTLRINLNHRQILEAYDRAA